MTIVSNDPAWWPTIDSYRVLSYFVVAAFVGLIYDWALTFGQEVELIWRQRWSLVTVLYLGVRYLGILYAVLDMLSSVPAILLTDTEWVLFFATKLLGSLMTTTLYCHRCWIMYLVWNWTRVLVFAMLWVIMITRLHAMYQGSRNILIFFIVTFLAGTIFNGVIAIMTTMYTSGEELILSGTYQCSIGSVDYAKEILLLDSIAWIVSIVWEVLALCLAVWIAVKHFREQRQPSAGGNVRDCFVVLIKTHIVYFASFVAVSCFSIVLNFSPVVSTDQNGLNAQIYSGFLQVFTVVQSFVLGPRLILGIREYHAKLVVDSDAATGMTSIAFQERVHISTGISV